MKNIFLSCLFFGCSLTAANQPLPVYEGSWKDGAAFAWQCQPGATGKVLFMFKTSEGVVYQGQLSCGTSI